MEHSKEQTLNLLQALEKIKEIRELELVGAPIDDFCLKGLLKLKQLVSLNISSSKVGIKSSLFTSLT